IADNGRELLSAEVCSVFLRQHEGYLSLEANSGSPPGTSRIGMKLEIKSGEGTGLTGHIAKIGMLVNLHGEQLRNHQAIANSGPRPHLPSLYINSLLAIPFKHRSSGAEELIGLIIVENKKGRDGKLYLEHRFDQQDELFLKTLASYAEIAIQNAQ